MRQPSNHSESASLSEIHRTDEHENKVVLCSTTKCDSYKDSFAHMNDPNQPCDLMPLDAMKCSNQGDSKTNQSLADANHLRILSSIQACKTRAILTADQAAEIFTIHLANLNQAHAKARTGAAKVASAFGVGEKTVRDIWRGRTWIRELAHAPRRTRARRCARTSIRAALNRQVS